MLKTRNHTHKRGSLRGKACALALSTLLVAGGAVGGTYAYLSAKTDTLVNTFAVDLPTKGDLTGLTIQGSKALEGRDWEEGDSFQFILERAVENQDGSTSWKALGEPATVEYAVDEDGAAVEGFEKFDLSKAIEGLELTEGDTLSLRLSEDIPADADKLPGVAYDAACHYFDVTVADEDEDGTLEISSVVSADQDADSAAGEEFFSITQDETTGAWAVDASFVNTYSVSGTAQALIKIEKTLEDESGLGLTPAGFEFELYEGEVTEGEESVKTVATLATGEADIVLEYGAEDAGKTFEYTLVEANAGETEEGLTYDDTRYLIQVDVTDEGDGTISAKVTDMAVEDEDALPYPVGSDGDDNAEDAEYLAAFKNVYDPEDATFDLSGAKTLEGAELSSYDGSFAFNLYSTGEDFFIDDSEAAPVDTAANEGGTFVFSELTFAKAGTYRYVVTEDASAKIEGMTYDEAVYQVTVTVDANAEDAGKLEAAASIKKVDDGTTQDAESILFENSWKAAGTDEPEPTPDPEPEPDPDKPADPDEPADTTTPTEPSDGASSGSADASGSAGEFAQTNDSTPVIPIVILACVAGVALILAAVAKRRSS